MSVKQKIMNKLADVITRGRKIQVKQGLEKDFKPNTLDVGEFGLITDKNEVRIGVSDGTSIRVNGDDVPDASTTQKGIVQLVDNLTTNDSTKALTAKQGQVLKQAIDEIGDGGNLSPEDRDKLDNLQKYVYGVGTRITTSTDLDTLITPGIYYTTNNAGTNLLVNAPTVRPNGSCIIEVSDGNGTTGLIQTIYYIYDDAANNKASSIYMRTKYGTFTEWSILPKLNPTILATTEKYDINKIINELHAGSGSSGGIGNIYQDHVITSGSGTAFGKSTEATGIYSYAEGIYSLSTGFASHAEGRGNSTGNYAHSEGYQTHASGRASHAGGRLSLASGDYSRAQGYQSVAGVYASNTIGQYNKDLNGLPDTYQSTADAFAIGNGTDGFSLSNAFRVTFNGKTYGQSAFNSTGADYAEYFEWEDGNIDNEDRVGCIVSLDSNKIRKANSSDTYILGVVSVNPSVIGDSHQDDWCDKYLTDEWGRVQYHHIDTKYDDFDEEGNVVIKTRQSYVPQLNPNWDGSADYIPREKRKEWSPVGLMGKLLVRDDGTCQINSFAKVGDIDGEVTHSDEVTNMRVMERVSDNIVRVFIK